MVLVAEEFEQIRKLKTALVTKQGERDRAKDMFAKSGIPQRHAFTLEISDNQLRLLLAGLDTMLQKEKRSAIVGEAKGE